MTTPTRTPTPEEWAEHARLLRNSNALLRTRLWSQYADVRREAAAEIEVADIVIAWIETPSTSVGAATWRSHARACRRTAEAMRRAVDRHFPADPAMQAIAAQEIEAELRVATYADRVAYRPEQSAA